MATLAKEELLKYLKDAIKLESSLVEQEQIRDAYKVSSDKRMPIEDYKPYPDVPKEEISKGETYSFLFAFLGGLNLVIGVPFLIASLFMIGSIIKDGNWGTTFGLAFKLIAVGVLLCLPYLYCKKGRKIIEQRKMESYYKTCSKIADTNATIRTKYNKDFIEWTASNRRIFNYLDGNKNLTKEALNKFYAKDVIFPKYRNLPALASIYEYIRSGRCEELTGATGAYNLYEEELRKDIVIAQLNTIISNLEQIRQNQYMLYEEIKKVQRNTAVIAVELDAIRGYTAALTELTALNTYYNGIAASNSQIMAYWG